MGLAAPDVRVEPVFAGTAPASWVTVKGWRRDGAVLYLHGGAFIAETPMFHGALRGRICRESRCRGLMPSYRLAPEHRYPAALDDCMAAYRWLLAQGHEAGRIVVAGDSAGGNLTLALLLRLRDESLPLPAGAVALSPVTDLTYSGESVRRNEGVDDLFSASMDGLVPGVPGRPRPAHPPACVAAVRRLRRPTAVAADRRQHQAPARRFDGRGPALAPGHPARLGRPSSSAPTSCPRRARRRSAWGAIDLNRWSAARRMAQ